MCHPTCGFVRHGHSDRLRRSVRGLYGAPRTGSGKMLPGTRPGASLPAHAPEVTRQHGEVSDVDDAVTVQITVRAGSHRLAEVAREHSEIRDIRGAVAVHIARAHYGRPVRH